MFSTWRTFIDFKRNYEKYNGSSNIMIKNFIPVPSPLTFHPSPIYFELINEKHHKFYEMMLSGNLLKINYGRIGRTGKVKIITFQSPEEALKFFEKQIVRRIKRGYHESIRGITQPRVKGFHPGQLRFCFNL